MLTFFFTLVCMAVIGAGVAGWHIQQQVNKPPPTDLQGYVSENPSPPAAKGRVVCAGDSLTLGNVSHNYVDWLAARLAGRLQVINAGRNGDTAYLLLERLDEITVCQPDYVIVLIGTNDLLTALEEEGKGENKQPAVAGKVFGARFEDVLRQICQRLKIETAAAVALTSIPPVGERSGSQAYRRALTMAASIRNVAMAENVYYLPLNEVMHDYLSRRKGARRSRRFSPARYRRCFRRALIDHFVLNFRLDDISSVNRFYLLTDFVHLNSRAAGMMVDLADDFVRKAQPPAKRI